jgi:hypothetical protein
MFMPGVVQHVGCLCHPVIVWGNLLHSIDMGKFPFVLEEC